MYDIKPLEDEWKKYNKAKKKPYFIALLGIAILGMASYLFLNKKNIIGTSLNSFKKEQSVLPKSKILNDVLVDVAFSNIQIFEKEKLDNIGVDDNIELIDKNVPILPMIENIPILEIKDPIVKPKPSKKVLKMHKIATMDIDKPRKKMKLDIIESSSTSAYKDVENRFYQSHDTDDSLFLAKSYFRKNNYKKSEYWALQTNQINNNIDESWIVFVKSKIKLGKKNEAMRILTEYAKKSNSSAAWNLLLQLKK